MRITVTHKIPYSLRATRYKQEKGISDAGKPSMYLPDIPSYEVNRF